MRCIVIDEEPRARLAIEDYIYAHPQLELVKLAIDPADITTHIVKKKIELVFLDIKMPAFAILELAKIVRDKALLIFVSAYPQYALESYELNAVDYLLKPVPQERFLDAIERAFSRRIGLLKKAAENLPDHLIEEGDKHPIKIFFREILYIEAHKNFVIIYTISQQIFSQANLKTILEKLPHPQFIKINKSTVVNKEHITAYNNNILILNSQKFKIGQVYRNNLIIELK